MPFGPSCEYSDFQECVDRNRDRDDPDAYCAAIQKRTEEHCMSNRAPVVGYSGLLTGVALEEDRPRLRLTRPVARQARPWYRIAAKAAEASGDDDRDEPTTDGDTTIIDIYDEIGWFGTGAADFVGDLRQVTTPKIELHLNSPGGDVFDAIAIYNGLRQHKAQVHVIVDSLAASAASFIAMSGDKITAMANAMMMIHDPLGLVIGNAADMREMGELLDKHGDNIAAIYAARAGGEVATWRERMLAETWYLADEAYTAGLVDEVDETDGRPIENAWDLTVFAHQPDATRPAATAVVEEAAIEPPTDHPAIVDDATGDAHPDVVTEAPEAGNGRRPAPLGATPSWFVPSSPRKETPQWQMR